MYSFSFFFFHFSFLINVLLDIFLSFPCLTRNFSLLPSLTISVSLIAFLFPSLFTHTRARRHARTHIICLLLDASWKDLLVRSYDLRLPEYLEQLYQHLTRSHIIPTIDEGFSALAAFSRASKWWG
jgi:hypothetical protein